MITALRTSLVLIGLLVLIGPAEGQWTPVSEVPETDIFSVWANGDTIAAGADSTVYVSTDAGTTWKTSTKVAASVTSVQALLVRNGRIYAGTFGQGLFVSDDLGTTWIRCNQGLVGGFANTQLFIVDLLVRGDSLYAATSGAGAWVLHLDPVGTWRHFGNAFEPNQASNMNGLAAGDLRLLAAAGFNGMVFFRDPGDTDWTVSFLNNVGLAPGLAPLSAAWTGHGWVVGSNIGVFHSILGEEPWTLSDPGLGTLFNVSFALRGRDLFASFGTGTDSVIEFSPDDGVTWQELETLNFTFIYKLAISGSDLYAGRDDGLWRRSIADVPAPIEAVPSRLRFAIAGSQPIGDQVGFRFDLPEPGSIVIDVFDVAGRRVAGPIHGSYPAGRNETVWNASGLGSGVYLARLTAGGPRAVVRMIRVTGHPRIPLSDH